MARSNTKWNHIKPSIFSVMTQKANEYQAINLAQGFPDFDGPNEIIEAGVLALRSQRNQYAPSSGLMELRQAIANHYRQRRCLVYSPQDEATIFSGATEALFCAMQAFLEPGDEVVACEPFYDSYPVGAYAAQAQLRPLNLTAPDWEIDRQTLNQAITNRTRMLLINSPHNPTGHVLSQREIALICDAAIEHDLLVVTDEVYEELVYPPHRHLSIANQPGMRERTVVISSTAKTFSLTGWKIGYALAPPNLTNKMRTVHQFTVFCSATPLQVGMLAAYELSYDYFDTLRADYQKRRDLLVRGLEAAGFVVSAPAGTYFALADYRHLSPRSDIDFCDWMVRELHVAAIPLSPFYADPVQAAKEVGHVRFAFCKDEKTIKAALENLSPIKAKIRFSSFSH